MEGNNMNKKIVAIVTALVVSGGVLMGTAYTSAAQLSGYDAYKSAIKDTIDLNNETADVKISVNDGAKNLVKVTSKVKVNSDTNSMSQVSTVKSGAGSETFSTSIQAGKSISKSSTSQVYKVRENNHQNFNKRDHKMNPQVVNSMETVMDILVGNMKNTVKVQPNAKVEGTQKIAINISEAQVVPLVNAVASIVMAKHSDEPMRNEKAGELDLKNMIPQLQSGIKIDSVIVTGDINKDNIINNQVAKIVLSGVDASGVTHNVTINADLNLSKINSTTPDTIDLTGKQVKTISNDFRGED